jgi:hypothetical protein
LAADGRNQWENRVQWARNALVQQGILDNRERGVWHLNPPYLASLLVINAHEGSCPEFQAFRPFIVLAIASPRHEMEFGSSESVRPLPKRDRAIAPRIPDGEPLSLPPQIRNV